MDEVHYFGDDPWATSSGYALEWENIVYPTAAHLYQALKFRYAYFRRKIAEASSAHKAKETAHAFSDMFPDAHVEDDWGNVRKLARMECVLRLKLTQHPELKKKLVTLGDMVLIADLPHPFWGRGKNGEGKNELGKLWGKLKDELVAQENQQATE